MRDTNKQYNGNTLRKLQLVVNPFYACVKASFDKRLDYFPTSKAFQS
ncbi:MAG TPA: hypothetical protein VK664_10960 [Flavitalea sp.]|nr:hypothetical protein [Flavitalea sp.]